MYELPPNSRLVTKRELALGILSKPTYRGDYSCERYLSAGDVVSFTIEEQTGFNAEFSINGYPRKRIWLSQLNPVFLSAEDGDLHCGIIYYNNGSQMNLGGMSVDKFMDAVRDKNFRVELRGDLYAIDFRNAKCQSLGTCGAVRDFICKALDDGRFKDVEGMTKPMTCYSFYEV